MDEKKCPTCGRTFGVDYDYCLNDGSVLSPYTTTMSSAPTEVFEIPTKQTPQSARSPLLYLLVGAMGATIAALAVAVYFLKPDANSPKVNDNVPAAQRQTPEKEPTANAAGGAGNAATPTIEPAKITESDARDLIEQWKSAQNQRNFTKYRSLYADSFVGIKDTPDGKSSRMNYGQWIADRRKMMPNVVDVRAENESVSVAGDAAVVRFTQRWRSLNHCDVGSKEITIRMFADGPKIVSEKISDPVNC